MTLVAAADGSALGNPGPAGWAWYIDDNSWAAEGSAHATNNQAELRAVLSLLTHTSESTEPLHVLCDSRYVIDSVTKWMPGWKRRGWKKADGKPVLNRDLLEQIDAALSDRTVTFEWVKGHAGHPLNERVDDLARASAEAYARRRTPETGPGFAGAQQLASPPLEEPATTGDDGAHALASELEHESITVERCAAEITVITANGEVLHGREDAVGALADDTLFVMPRTVTAVQPLAPDLLLVVSTPYEDRTAQRTSVWQQMPEFGWVLLSRVCAPE